MGDRTRWIVTCAVPVGLVLSGLLVWHSSVAAFTAQTSNPGNSFSAGTVALSDDDTGTGLGTYLNLAIDEGTGGGFGTCAGFSGSSIYTGTLANLASTSTNSASGVSSWTPSGSATRVYRFTYTLADNNAAAGLNSQVTFTWQASST